MDHAVRVQADPGERGREQIAAVQTPQDLTSGAREYPPRASGERGAGRTQSPCSQISCKDPKAIPQPLL
jgi:hypothetical protein